MNILKKTFAVVGLLSSAIALASTPVEILIPVEHIYVPKGFDSNDNTEVVVSGYLPNLCHKAPKSVVTVKGSTIDIKIMALKYETSNPFCPEVLVPFVEPVNVGLLNKGLYDIVVNGESIYKKEAKINIDESTSNAVDDHIYANVDYVEKTEGSRTVTLVGYNPSDCFILDEVNSVSNDVDTLAVLPKMKQISDFCPMKMIPFKYEMEVPSTLKMDKILLHVRAMDGKSVNTLFDNQAEE